MKIFNNTDRTPTTNNCYFTTKKPLKPVNSTINTGITIKQITNAIHKHTT